MKPSRLAGILNTPLFSLKDLTTPKSDWRQVISESLLDDKAKALIRNVVKRTRLWSGERHDVAEELVSHFMDGIESGRTEADLIQNFGNPHKAAGMIRRSKKKNRPLLWHLSVVLRNGFLSIVAVYTLMVLSAVNKSPSPKIDYKALIDSSVPDIPLENTARETYLALFKKYDFLKFNFTSPESREWEETVKAFNSTYKSALPEIRKAASFDHSGLRGKYPNEFTQEEYDVFFHTTKDDFLRGIHWNQSSKNISEAKYDMADIMFPHISILYNISKILNANIIISGSDNKWHTIDEDLESIFRIISHLIEDGSHGTRLFPYTCLEQAQAASLRLLLSPENLPETDKIRTILNLYNNYRFLCEFRDGTDKYMFLDIIQSHYSDSGKEYGVITKDGMDNIADYFGHSDWLKSQQSEYYLEKLKWTGINAKFLAEIHAWNLENVILPMIQKACPNRVEITEYFNELWDLTKKSATLPLWEAQKISASLEKSGRVEFEGMVINAPSQDNLGLLLPYFTFLNPQELSIRAALNRSNYDNTRLILALHGFYQETGHWPEALSDLVSGWLDEVPPDASTGKPLIYRIEDGKPLIYGRGYDGVDDGGQFAVPDKPGFHWGQQPSDTGDWLIWPVPVIAEQGSAVH